MHFFLGFNIILYIIFIHGLEKHGLEQYYSTFSTQDFNQLNTWSKYLVPASETREMLVYLIFLVKLLTAKMTSSK